MPIPTGTGRVLWKPIKPFPLTATIYNSIPKGARRSLNRRPELVSEPIWDAAVERLSPYLLRNAALDIIDLWPGAGVLSSKIHDLLRPRRHLLFEPGVCWKFRLDPLVQSDPSSYKLIHTNDDQLIASSVTNWSHLVAKHLPEQEAANRDPTDPALQNSTLLVLANPPTASTDKSHFTPSRWWLAFMKACMQLSGVHAYGSVRLLASLPTLEASAIIPRYVTERRRPAIWTENVALHAFEVMSPPEDMIWVNHKDLNLAMKNAACVAKRSAETNTPTPFGRERPPLMMAPESPNLGRKPTPYIPRIRTSMHDRLWADITAPQSMNPSSPAYAEAERKSNVAQTRLNTDNRNAHSLAQQVDHLLQIDQLYRSLSHMAADPKENAASLQPILDKIAALKEASAEDHSDQSLLRSKRSPLIVDNYRASLHKNDFDDSVLLWDRRPFEPLTIEFNETYPRGIDRSYIYFEPNPNPPFAQKLANLDKSQREDAANLFEAISAALGRGRDPLTVSEIFKVIAPDRPANDIVRAVPILAEHAAKTPKPDFDSLPKTVHGESRDGCPPDPALSFQENLDYDLSEVRVHSLSISTLWDICVEYVKGDNPSLSLLQMNRSFGGIMTSSTTGILNSRRLH
ncbi:hypothetical protein BO71DRAFT_444301 [Aspergillus ellipticus CBS 707.79]|uniref:S-adenosyl-L-methionine-dependent methyltransferase n=1 Tax=Aspergillus ellipticus CBS 707.79 TaxID=1448320 RepID=A0A319CXT3_9EURO|nr:hypothetical protein BO71DRAFT_444301 [Aspergillus ellipticus CBS 707.79]